MILTKEMLTKVISSIQGSKKYAYLNLPEETIDNLVVTCANNYRSLESIEKATRKKLHNIVADYLGEPDYSIETLKLEKEILFTEPETLKNYCINILNQHASTHERIPHYEIFYQEIFSITGNPKIILDLACGLNPFSIPYINLPSAFVYYAFDINKPRVDFINTFFRVLSSDHKAFHQDILLNPPLINADVIFLLKESHRLEKRQRGSNTNLLKSLFSKNIVISLPRHDLKNHHNLEEHHRELINRSIKDLYHSVKELIIGDELIFILKNEEQYK